MAPMLTDLSSAAGRADSLRRLTQLRWLALAAQWATIGVVLYALEIQLPLAPLAAISGALAVLNGATVARLHAGVEVGEGTLLWQLLADIAALAGMLYCTGGWANPFVSMFLLPLVIGAIVLPARYVWVLAASAFAAYSLLVFVYVPLPHLHEHGGDFTAHVLGMWVSFVLSAATVAYFVVRMAASLRLRDRLLAQARERTLRDQQVLALGTLAAGAAHELGTPLSTIGVLAQELESAPDMPARHRPDLALLRGQVTQCKRIISELAAASGHQRAEGGYRLPLDDFLRSALRDWQALRPGMEVAAHWIGPQPGPTILAEQTVRQTLISLLNNAADASPQGIELEGRWDAAGLSVEIRDRGDGFAPGAQARAGREPFSTRPGTGLGVGLLIARSSVERLGGTVTLLKRPDGGACTRIDLPLGALLA
jgi:two-component system sensor histidine kinase RegB